MIDSLIQAGPVADPGLTNGVAKLISIVRRRTEHPNIIVKRNDHNAIVISKLVNEGDRGLLYIFDLPLR